MSLPEVLSEATYTYSPLPSLRHIRLLEISNSSPGNAHNEPPTYTLTTTELPSKNTDPLPLSFEAVSYTWGHHTKTSFLPIHPTNTTIPLTQNLTMALPNLAKHSSTTRLWIDQICINQSSPTERASQVTLMSEIYARATRVLVWLGEADTSSRMCRQWLDGIAALVPTMKSAARISRESPNYNANVRALLLRDTFSAAGTDACWANAIAKFWGRAWFKRGWIVQEFLLARDLLCLAGSEDTYSRYDLEDLFTVPEQDVSAVLDATNGSVAYRVLMELKMDGFESTPQPLRFLRLMAAVASEFETKELGDRLFGFLGLIPGLDFVPDYTLTVSENFTRFAATLARQYGSLNFLSLWSANLDALIEGTPEELRGFPSWVPSFQWLPLTAPWRLAVAGARSSGEIFWDACRGRRHVHDQTFDAASTRRLCVRGRIVDYIHGISSARIAKTFEADEAYRKEILEQIQRDLKGFEDWSILEMITFLNVVSCNGNQPKESAEQLLGLVPGVLGVGQEHLSQHASSLAICMTMGRGRRFITTEQSRKGLGPYIGSRAKEGEVKGSAIVVLHGCCVPMVLERVGTAADGEEWTVIGDCYVEGIMHGEAVGWEESETQKFLLV